jgi:hypothetical protein
MFDRMVQRLGVTNGQLTREQVVNMMRQQQGQGGQTAPGGMPASTGDAQGGAQGGGRGRWGSPEGIASMAESRFRQLDTNQDGFLNNDEMPEELQAERDKWDTDKNGLIDLTEYRAYFQARVQQFMVDRNAAGRQGWQGWQGGWQGPWGAPNALPEPAPAEPEERKPVVYRTGKLPKELPAWFQDADEDKDAQIGLYEWKAKGWPIQKFLEMDRNGDGFLTVTEVLRYEAEQKKTSNGTGNDDSRGSGNGSLASGFQPSGGGWPGNGGGRQGGGGGFRGRGGWQGGGGGGWPGGGGGQQRNGRGWGGGRGGGWGASGE